MALKDREILIIDDDPMIRKLVRKVLEGSGIGVCEAESVKEAFVLAENRGPHAVITDLSMPEEDGFSFLEKRRNTAALKKIPVLVLSALGDKKSVFRAMALGAVDYVVKPFNAKSLLQKLRKALKDASFARYHFEKSAQPQVLMSTPARIMMINDVGFLLEAPVKIATDTKVEIKSTILDKLRMTECHLRSSKEPSRPGHAGLYLKKIDAIAIPQEISKHIRTTLRTWK